MVKVSLQYQKGLSSLIASWAAISVMAAFSLSAQATELKSPLAGFWAPVLLQHQDFGREKDGYPVPFGDPGNGEFTLYTWHAASSKVDNHPQTTRLGYFWQYATEDALGVVLEVSGREKLVEAVFMGPSQCETIPGEALTHAIDPEGRHPIMSVQGLSLSTGFGVIEGVVPAVDGEVDWLQLPQDGRRFFRTWNNPPHLRQMPPDIDGIVIRYEPQGGYALGNKSGRGNTPHHWNLLAYQLQPLDTTAPEFVNHSSQPTQWPCSAAFFDGADDS